MVRAGFKPPSIGAQLCTGMAAHWCPNHGTCTCSEHQRANHVAQIECPLHGVESEHPLPLRYDVASGAGNVRCACGAMFASPDVVEIKMCPRCLVSSIRGIRV